ncbi:MAG: hypothetical protein ABFD75_07745 [Smithella sp.]
MTNSDPESENGNLNEDNTRLKDMLAEKRKAVLKDMSEDKRKAVLDEVSSWLGRLVLLYGVPFHYLIPEEAMLPGGSDSRESSLRFFYLDPIWIQYLVQGACSVGSNGYGDFIIDEAMNEWVQPNRPKEEDQKGIANQKAASIRDRLRLEHEGVDLPGEDTCLDWPLTGFLLRSPVVEGWRGLEVLAYKFNQKFEALDEDKKNSLLNDLYKYKDDFNKQKVFREEYLELLKPLRIEQLSKDVMLGIFNGKIAELVIRQPQEGLHFGVTVISENGPYTKKLRDLGNNDQEQAEQPKKAGTPLAGDPMPIPMRVQEKESKYPGVIDIEKTAAAMKEILFNEGELKEDKFTSAEFAVEMIEAAGEFTYLLNIQSSSSNTGT